MSAHTGLSDNYDVGATTLLVCKVESEVRAVYILPIYPMTYMINGYLVRFKYRYKSATIVQ